MSDRPIQVNDLVMVVRPKLCCNWFTGAEGQVFQVTGLTGFINEYCAKCRCPDNDNGASGLSAFKAIQVSRLKRLDPDALLEDVPTKEELHA